MKYKEKILQNPKNPKENWSKNVQIKTPYKSKTFEIRKIQNPVYFYFYMFFVYN